MSQDQSPPPIPAGVPSLLRVGSAADVLGLSAGTVAGWARRGYVQYAQPGVGKWRYFSAVEINRVAFRFGISPDWLRTIE